jgi:hypothetical protein
MPDWAFIEEEDLLRNWSDRIDKASLGDYALYLGDGYMIHGTLYQRYLGRVTHGCIRLGDADLSSPTATRRHAGVPVLMRASMHTCSALRLRCCCRRSSARPIRDRREALRRDRAGAEQAAHLVIDPAGEVQLTIQSVVVRRFPPRGLPAGYPRPGRHGRAHSACRSSSAP